MALNSSGPISLAGTTAGQSIELENGGNGTTQISLNDAAVRTLAGVPSGAIIMPTNFYGKSNRATISYTFSANTANASLNVAALGGYSAGKSDITITISSGIYLYSTSTGTPGLNLTGGTTGDTITLVNNGYIMGQGGTGGSINPAAYVPATAGGTALSLGYPTTVNNTNASAYIGGGGGGGSVYGGGGGAGGGPGGFIFGNPVQGNGGAIGAKGNNATPAFSENGKGGGAGGGAGAYFNGGKAPSYTGAGGGGGRIFPGVSGAGGNSGDGSGNGGNGGAGNATGGNNGAYTLNNGGGGWGAAGGFNPYNGASPAGGKAVALNGKTVTWTSGDTTRVYGSVA